MLSHIFNDQLVNEGKEVIQPKEQTSNETLSTEITMVCILTSISYHLTFVFVAKPTAISRSFQATAFFNLTIGLASKCSASITWAEPQSSSYYYPL
jgi:hypothetical protein